MGDKNYKRTTRYRNWMNRRGWWPIIKNGFAHMIDGRIYEVRDDGWRRIKQGGRP